MRRRGKMLSGVVALGLLAAACGGEDDATAEPNDNATAEPNDNATAEPNDNATAEPNDNATAEPNDNATAEPSDDDGCTADRAGGELTMIAGSLVLAPGFGPVASLGAGYGNTESIAVFDTLMRYNPDTGVIEPHLAESLEANADHTSFTLTLREGITFGNGDPLTSDAVVYSIEYLAASPRVAAGMAQAIESMETPDELTVVFNLDETWVGFPYLLAHSGGMVVNPSLVEERGDDFAINPVGAGVGPYEFVSYAPDEEIVLQAKDDYWGGPVCIETLRFINVSGNDGRYDTFRNDEVDAVFLNDPTVIADMRADGVAEMSWIGSGYGFHINSGRTEDPLLEDVRLRRAIAYAIDANALNDRLYEGDGLPNTGMTHPDQLIYSGVDGPQFDPDLARALVQEYVDETGEQPVVNLVVRDSQAETDLGIDVGAMLENVGFGTEIENLAAAAFGEQVFADGSYDLATGFGTIFDESPERAAGLYTTGSPTNRTGFSDPDVDAGFAALREVVLPEDRAEKMAELQELWNEHVPAVYLFTQEWYIGVDEHVHGIQPTIAGVVMLQDAWLDQG